MNISKINHNHLSRSLLLTLLSLLLLTSCNLFTPNTTTYDVTLEPGESYDIDLDWTGYDKAALIKIEPAHASISRTYHDTTNYNIHYCYTPDSSYTGRDYVKIQLEYLEHLYDSSFKTEGYVEINFTICEP